MADSVEEYRVWKMNKPLKNLADQIVQEFKEGGHKLSAVQETHLKGLIDRWEAQNLHSYLDLPGG